MLHQSQVRDYKTKFSKLVLLFHRKLVEFFRLQKKEKNLFFLFLTTELVGKMLKKLFKNVGKYQENPRIILDYIQ